MHLSSQLAHLFNLHESAAWWVKKKIPCKVATPYKQRREKKVYGTHFAFVWLCLCVCVCVCDLGLNFRSGDGRSVGTAPLSRCAAILDLQEASDLLKSSKEEKKKQQLLQLSPFVSCLLTLFVTQPQSYSRPTLPTGWWLCYLNLFFLTFICVCFFQLPLIPSLPSPRK